MAQTKPKILIIDDDKFLLDMYAIKFTQSGFEVSASLGSQDGLEKLRGGFIPDVILTDILMPQMDGFEFLEAVKNEKLAPHAKRVILSNKGERGDLDRGQELKVDDYIIKASAIPSEVVAKVMALL